MPEILAEVQESIDITATVAATPGSLTDDYNDLQNHPSINGVELEGDKTTSDLHIDHVPLADNLVATTGTTSTTPYTLRSAPSFAGSVAELKKIVGGTVGWNQMISSFQTPGGNCTVTVADGVSTMSDFTARYPNITSNGFHSINGHKYFVSAYCKYAGTISDTIQLYLNNRTTQYNVPAIKTGTASNTWVHAQGVFAVATDENTTSAVKIQVNEATYSNITSVSIKDVCLFDLTAMFGSTIADYITALETATAGSGVAFFRSLFPSDYYPYSAPTLASVQTSARQALDGNGDVIRSYPIDDVVLRGIPKLTNGQLAYDGDIYLPTGDVTRKYGEVDLGSFTWGTNQTGTNAYEAYTTGIRPTKANGVGNFVCAKLPKATSFTDVADYSIRGFSANGGIAVKVPKTVASTGAGVKQWLTDNNVKLVYELATPTTETADPYTEVQLAGTTEQFVTENYIPVGNESFYPTDLTGVVQNLAPLPTSAGTYKLQVTVSGGVPSYAWVAG